jgi:dephospho-CoA kinase
VSEAYWIGVTGDVGSGKSTVCRWLESRGASAFDADEAVHRLLAGEGSLIEAIGSRFGAHLVTVAGVDRSALAELVFGDREALADLERLVHPHVAAAARRWKAGVSAPFGVIEAVKLVESGMHAEVDELWLITCDRAIRQRRLIERGWSADEAAKRMAAGSPLAPRLKIAHVVIDNSGDRSATEMQLAVAWEEAIRRAAAKSQHT